MMTSRRWILIGLVLVLLAITGCDGNYSSGDRVLVSKLNSNTPGMSPSRYDVVVFKYPGKRVNGTIVDGPMDKNTPKNYIKRLLGLPGEILAIFFGRLYHRPSPPDAPFFDDEKEGVHPNDLWHNIYMHATDETGQEIHERKFDAKGKQMRTWFEEGKFQPLRKPPAIMLAMRRLVYDNNFQAKDMKGKHDRWSPSSKSGWKADKETGFVNEGNGDSVDWIRYRHLIRPDDAPLPPAGGIQPTLIVDAMSYNDLQLGAFDKGAQISPYWVGDLMIECDVESIDGKGEFWLELSKGINRFRAKWDFATGVCTLYREGPDKQLHELDSQPTNAKGAGTYLLRFANIDSRLTVWVGRSLPFGDGKDYDPPEVFNEEDVKQKRTWADIENRRGPTDNDLQPASIGSKGARVSATNIRLWRDTYYSTMVSGPDYSIQRDALGDPKRWDSIRRARFMTMYVQPGHFLCLGDNSQASSDSRDWGLVPERLMLGRALVVYFPLDRVGPIR